MRDGAPRNSDHPNVCMSPLDKRWERKRLHLTDCFIAVHQKEHFFFARSVVNELYVRVPDWFSEYEVSYSLIHETPPVLTYKGSALMRDPTDHMWQLFMTEYAALVAQELMYQVESAGRLHWPPEK